MDYYDSINTLLLDQGDSRTVSHSGFTELHHLILSERNNDDAIKTLLDQGASPAARSSQGDTPLHLTLISRRYTMELGEDVVSPIDDRLFLLEENPFGSNGFSHCHIACLFDKLEIVRSFLDRGLDPNEHRVRGPFRMERRGHQWHGDTCLHVATFAGHSDVVQLLLERGANPNIRNAMLCTPLHSSMYDFEATATKLLLEHGADVNARNRDDITPLHVQFSHFHWEFNVANVLIAAGADVNVVNRFGFTVLDQAVVASKYEIDEDTRNLLWCHVVSLHEADLELSKENLKYMKKKVLREFRSDCRFEIKRMSRKRLDARITLYDALRARHPRMLHRFAANKKYGRIIAGESARSEGNKKYPIYGHLLRLKYCFGARIAEAVPALQKIYANSCTTKDDDCFLEECAEMILYYLTYEELWFLIQAVLR